MSYLRSTCFDCCSRRRGWRRLFRSSKILSTPSSRVLCSIQHLQVRSSATPRLLRYRIGCKRPLFQPHLLVICQVASADFGCYRTPLWLGLHSMDSSLYLPYGEEGLQYRSSSIDELYRVRSAIALGRCIHLLVRCICLLTR